MGDDAAMTEILKYRPPLPIGKEVRLFNVNADGLTFELDNTKFRAVPATDTTSGTTRLDRIEVAGHTGTRDPFGELPPNSGGVVVIRAEQPPEDVSNPGKDAFEGWTFRHIQDGHCFLRIGTEHPQDERSRFVFEFTPRKGD